jgi:hypothetical protein
VRAADDDGPLCHFEVDEHGEIHQRVDPALSAVLPLPDAHYLALDYVSDDVWSLVLAKLSDKGVLQLHVTTPDGPSRAEQLFTRPRPEFVDEVWATWSGWSDEVDRWAAAATEAPPVEFDQDTLDKIREAYRQRWHDPGIFGPGGF